MFESNGLLPHPPESEVMMLAKKVPFINSTKRAQVLLYVVAAILFAVSFLIIVYSVNANKPQVYKTPVTEVSAQ